MLLPNRRAALVTLLSSLAVAPAASARGRRLLCRPRRRRMSCEPHLCEEVQTASYICPVALVAQMGGVYHHYALTHDESVYPDNCGAGTPASYQSHTVISPLPRTCSNQNCLPYTFRHHGAYSDQRPAGHLEHIVNIRPDHSHAREKPETRFDHVVALYPDTTLVDSGLVYCGCQAGAPEYVRVGVLSHGTVGHKLLIGYEVEAPESAVYPSGTWRHLDGYRWVGIVEVTDHPSLKGEYLVVIAP